MLIAPRHKILMPWPIEEILMFFVWGIFMTLGEHIANAIALWLEVHDVADFGFTDEPDEPDDPEADEDEEEEEEEE